MKQLPKVFFTFSFLMLFSIPGFSQETTDKEQRYIFFFHNKFVEENDLSAAHPEYGKAEYNEIIDSFKKR